MKSFNTSAKDQSKDEWLTPPIIFKSLGKFDLDPCAPIKRPWPTASKHYTIRDDGLSKPWHGRVWLNPPYGRETFVWLERLADHGSGIALIFARTETRGFHDVIWKRAHAVFFFKGRLTFHHVSGKPAEAAANAPSCLVSYSEADTRAIQKSGLPGHLVLV